MVLITVFEQYRIGRTRSRPRAVHLRCLSSLEPDSELKGHTAVPHSWMALPALVRVLILAR